MTTKEALDLLDKATSYLEVNRATHIKIAEAIRVLNDEITKKQEIPVIDKIT